MRLLSARTGNRILRAILCVAVALSLCLSTSGGAFAAGGIQGNLSGSVVDDSSGKPIADVAVTASSPSGTFNASTDASGHFVMLGLPPDTYTVSLTKAHYQPTSIAGVSVFGDMNNTVGIVRMKTELVTIARVTSRARNSAYQPTQTQDTTTISGERITQALGNPNNQNEQNLILAAPGAIQDVQGGITVRGSLNTELGYQYDGVDFTVPFFDGNGSSGYLANLTGGSGGSLQVVSGAGDATQGNIGAGVINIIPPRGTYPAKADASLLVGEPYFQHQADVSYSWSTPDNRFSDFVSYDGSRSTPEYAPYGVDASAVGAYFGTSYVKHDDIQNNFVFRFGHQKNMSLQWLFRSSLQQAWGNYGGLAQAGYYPYNPLANSSWTFLFPQNNAIDNYQSLVYLEPGVPATPMQPSTAEETLYQPLAFNKIGYTWNMNPTTFLSLNWANFYQQSGGSNYTNGSFLPGIAEVGGQRIFSELDLTHQFGINHITTLAARYEDDLPRWYQSSPWFSMLTMGYIYSGINSSLASAGLGPNEPGVEDFFTPNDLTQPVSAANPCPVTYGCYVYDYMQQNGLWKGPSSMPRIPAQGIDYHHAIFHQAGIGIRDQWAVNERLRLDYGLRIDLDKMDWGYNPYGGPTQADALSNPSDVTVATKLGANFLYPKIWQPRFAADYQLDTNDAFRFAYGRSVDFFFAQTAGTPFDLGPVPSFFLKMPAKDSAAGQAIYGATGVPVLAPAGPGCGSGWNDAYPASAGVLGHQWPCSNYAQSLYWVGDQFLDAPDLGGDGPPTYNNWDLGWSHGFSKGILNGFGLKLTGFARRGYNVEQNTLIANGPPNPVTGQTSAAVFQTNANGVEKTYGLEFMLTSPDRPQGLSGFLTMNYISEWSSSPPVDAGNYANDSLPILFTYEFNAGQLYRSAFLPPFQGRLGLTEKIGGWKITPIFAFDGGFPTGIGSQTYGAVNGQYIWMRETNFGAATPLGGPNGPGNPYNASYFVDPANPGSYLNPNIAASRGYDEPALPGGKLTVPHGYLDLNLEYTPRSSGITLGMYVSNIFNNHYGLWYPNQQYQAVATGVSGPQTGEIPGAYPSPNNPFWVAGTRDNFPLTMSGYPFQVPYNPGTTIQFYLTHRV
jgi:hypothetical protein